MARAALIGANGQLGSDIVRLWSGSRLGQGGDELIGLTHADIEITNRAFVRSIMAGIRPTLVINTAAYHLIDECEEQPERAFEVNALGVKNLAEVCAEMSVVLMHFSTDAVFSGSKGTPYTEADPVGPVNAFGVSKAAGEHFLRYILPDRHIIVRSSGLFGVRGASGKGGNFIDTMIRMAREGRPLRVVNDQVASPTYTLDLASALIELIAGGARGTYHITGAGQCTWYELAVAIFQQLQMQPDLEAVTSEEYGAPARRPPYSVLDNGAIERLGIARPRSWQEVLPEYLRLKGWLKT